MPNDPLINERALKVIEEKVAILNGDRGNPDQYALRQAQLNAVREALGGLIKRANLLNANFDALDASVADIMARIAALQTQLDAINAALPTIVADLTVRVTAIEVFTADIGTVPPPATGGATIYHL